MGEERSEGSLTPSRARPRLLFGSKGPVRRQGLLEPMLSLHMATPVRNRNKTQRNEET